MIKNDIFSVLSKNVTIDFYKVLNDVKNVIAYSDPANAENNKTTEKDAKKRRELLFRGMEKVRKRRNRRRVQTVRLIVSRNGLLTKRTEYGIIKPKASNGAGRGARGAKPRPSFKSMCLFSEGSTSPLFLLENDTAAYPVGDGVLDVPRKSNRTRGEGEI